MILNDKYLYNIKGGGTSLSATAFNAVSRLVSTLLKLGQTVGSSIRRMITKSYC